MRDISHMYKILIILRKLGKKDLTTFVKPCTEDFFTMCLALVSILLQFENRCMMIKQIEIKYM